jgi:hypothetical protein
MKDCVALYSGLQGKRKVIFEFESDLIDRGESYLYIISKNIKGLVARVQTHCSKQEWEDYQEQIKITAASQLKDKINPIDPAKRQKALEKIEAKKNAKFISINGGAYTVGAQGYAHILSGGGSVTLSANVYMNPFSNGNWTILP